MAAVLAAALLANAACAAAESADASRPAPYKAVVAYFSVTGNTKRVAETIAKTAQADLYEIVPRIPYSKADLDYKTPGCRSSEEFKDPSARPEMYDSAYGLGSYSIIYLGFPIWYGTAPRIIYTFLESQDLMGKTVIPFCTSGSSGIDKALEDLLPLGRTTRWLKGKRFSSDADPAEAEAWVKSLGLETTGKEPGRVKTLNSSSTAMGDKLSGIVSVKHFPEFLWSLYTEYPYSSIVSCYRQKIEDAVYVTVDQWQLNGLASVGYSYHYLTDPVTDVMEKDPCSALKEFRRVEQKSINKDFAYALYDTRRFTAGKERSPLNRSDYLAVIRYR